MRHLYSLLWWLAMPLVLARLWWRGRHEPGYRQHWGERLGWYRKPVANSAENPAVPTLWVHAVSVGETRAAQPLIDALLAAHPAHRIVLTHMTPTGRATGAALFAHHGARLVQRYLPYDLGSMVGRFLRAYEPQACILIETEVWPNLVAQCNRRAVPVVLVNARLSARSLARGLRMQGLLGAAARGLAGAGAQTAADAARLAQMGVEQVTVTGSIKFDVLPPAAQAEQGRAWRTRFGNRSVLLFASTREGEEEAILAALAVVPVDALLVIVPRHPQRFDAVADLITARGLRLARRSTLGEAPLTASTQVLLGDSMGELFAYYAAADLAFIGGSLLPLGGQNLIEACAVGTPVLIGPSSFNFAAVTEEAIDAGAALRVDDAPALLATAQAVLADAAVRRAMAGAAQAFAEQHRGATARTMRMLETVLPAIFAKQTPEAARPVAAVTGKFNA
ncbi:MAG: lipid IV(A) 3-deoxy-D-manno-octulosonic acid transferase [Herminiimonas sp.]|nr:lipid IV(A) 3-deoxy-D-manno-octulosonic acid transferase [Herminiimonas sp.]